ncbi:DUF3347 domain-containing protein [Mucilaginibacter sp.]|uniref:DUF3347 domain-containing protein n=1 Tax=Mucilaginibacter sp. TaxID=1882438 RepID=UPI002852135B|nr:DUF3347 domain-containing protein [Mucilaginibacter sp.]MDR3697677.1 DUF3347 domain-containing protein [Mucilaginibacter sp.]
MKVLKKSAWSLIVTMLFIIPVKAQNAALNKSINTVITNYLALKNALIAADGNTAENKAKVLLASINEVSKADFTAKQLALWTNYEPKLEFDSRHISEVNALPHQREHFASLSNNLFAVLKELKLNEKPIYRQYCIMKRQYFLSDATGGKDPYMGMEHCSKVTETLPAVK